MTYGNYHIGYTISEKYLEVRIFLLKGFRRFTSVLSFLHFKTGIVKGINKDLSKLLKYTEAFKIKVRSYDKERANKFHIDAEKGLKRVKSLYYKLEAANFFGLSRTQSLAEDILSNFYEIEATVRNIAFSKEENFSTDKKLQEFASYLSLTLDKRV